MRKPKLEHYPKWLREMICEPIAMSIRGVSTNREVDDALRKIYSEYRVNPISTVLFDLSIEIIRNRFSMWKMQNKMDLMQEQINELKNTKAKS